MKSLKDIQLKKQYKITRIEIDKSVICFVAISKEQDIAGKCSFKIREGDIIRYQDAYVSDNHRNQGIYKSLFHARQLYVEENYPNHQIEAFCRKSTLPLFQKEGFEICENLYWVKKL